MILNVEILIGCEEGLLNCPILPSIECLDGHFISFNKAFLIRALEHTRLAECKRKGQLSVIITN